MLMLLKVQFKLLANSTLDICASRSTALMRDQILAHVLIRAISAFM